jgi:hypothetical protein
MNYFSDDAATCVNDVAAVCEVIPFIIELGWASKLTAAILNIY